MARRRGADHPSWEGILLAVNDRSFLGENRGFFLALEGMDGSGKTTQVDLLSKWFFSKNLKCTVAREPGGTKTGEAIRSVVQENLDLDIPPETELLLYLAARSVFVKEIAIPVLDRGEIFLTDRFSMSTLAYQGYARGLDLTEVGRLNDFASAGLNADLYIVLDIPAELSRERLALAKKKKDRLELSGVDFMQKVRSGYLDISRKMENAIVVDGTENPETIHLKIREILIREMPTTFGI